MDVASGRRDEALDSNDGKLLETPAPLDREEVTAVLFVIGAGVLVIHKYRIAGNFGEGLNFFGEFWAKC